MRKLGLIDVLVVSGIIAAALWVGLQPRQPDLPTYQYGERKSADYQAGGTSCDPRALASIRDSGKAATERKRCADAAEEHRLKSEDLVQQARAADAAQAQAWTNYDLARMALWGTIGGFLTLIAASLAAYFAREAAKATRDTVNVFTEVERANIVVTLGTFEEWGGFYDPATGTTGTNPTEERLSFSVSAHNVGRSTAIIMRAAAGWHDAKSLPENMALIGPLKTYIVEPAKNAALELHTSHLISELDKLRFFWVLLTYNSPLHGPRCVRYCFEVWGRRSETPYIERSREEWDAKDKWVPTATIQTFLS